jgi:23S rRNA pseudouridine2605 synthase
MSDAERIQKVLANAGYGSRREIEDWIRLGRIKVNGKAVTLGDRIGMRDRISLDGKLLKFQQTITAAIRIIAYNKPAGQICSRKDREGRPTVFDKLPKIQNARWVNIGRLDINTHGLIMFTNNGTLANRLMHPSREIEREYAVRVLPKATQEQLQILQDGVELEDGVAAFTSIEDKGGEGANHWYHIVIKEGRNREVRRLWESQGLMVSRLIRVRYGPYKLPRFKSTGQCWELSKRECEELFIAAGMDEMLEADVEKEAMPVKTRKKPVYKAKTKTKYNARK